VFTYTVITDEPKRVDDEESRTGERDTQEDTTDKNNNEQEHQNRQESMGNWGTDLGTADTGPRQVRHHCFPSGMFGQQKRSFQPSWFDTFKWVEYSTTANAAFCFSCRLYGKQKQSRDQRDTLTTSGYTNWKRALDSFREHEKSNIHKALLSSSRQNAGKTGFLELGKKY